MVFKGITKRWVLNVLSVIVATVILVIVCLSFLVHSLFYSSIEQTITDRSNELSNVFIDYKAESISDFTTNAREYVESFPDKGLMELMVINSAGEALINSTGFAPDENQEMPDFEQAKNSSSGFAKWTGRLNSGESVMSVTRVIHTPDGDTLGAVRYVVSLENANFRIFLITITFIAVGLLIIFFVYFSGSYFVRSIVHPVREMSAAATKIAQGDFDATIDKMYDDEIGELCDSINNMARELQNNEQMKNDFISRVSHELRTPLTAIKGWAETMQFAGASDEETFNRGMSVIINESSRLTGIVEELLDFSRLQNKKLTLFREPLDIIAELDEAIYMLKERALKEGKHLLFDEPDKLMPAISGDKNRLRQVFINVLDNALKYTPTGGVIGIQALRQGDSITIAFSDNGCGIPAEDLPHVKEKFYKANKKVSGSGIGLAVADEIMTLHGGSLDIESSENIGTTVTLTLPIIKEEQPPEENNEEEIEFITR